MIPGLASLWPANPGLKDDAPLGHEPMKNQAWRADRPKRTLSHFSFPMIAPSQSGTFPDKMRLMGALSAPLPDLIGLRAWPALRFYGFRRNSSITLDSQTPKKNIWIPTFVGMT